MKRAVGLGRAVGQQVKLLGPVVESNVRWILLVESGELITARWVPYPCLEVARSQWAHFESHGVKSGCHQLIAERAHNCGDLGDAVILTDQYELGVLDRRSQNGHRGTIQAAARHGQRIAVLEESLFENGLLGRRDGNTGNGKSRKQHYG